MDISEFNGLPRAAQIEALRPYDYTNHLYGHSGTIPPDLIGQLWAQAPGQAQAAYLYNRGTSPFALLPPAGQSPASPGIGQVPAQEPFGRGSTMLDTPPPPVSGGAPPAPGPAPNVPTSDAASMITALRGQ